uniref:Uncharacterized protein n=1 Tax=Alexandrium catenella TaxID=2925 RepID=A0A7S1QFU9_ALECA|mmetsp:Transcript_31443/g.85326  ORF Transcript_31443/g.85326 Transcript_31443/m.85326 type:complete len:154 (+) Transcript_31443:2-463(+)
MPVGAVMPSANGPYMPPATGSYVPPPVSTPGNVPSYSPPPVMQGTNPYGSGSVSLTSGGSFQLPPGGGAVVQPQVAAYGAGNYMSVPARTMLPAASSFQSARPDQLASSGYVSVPAMIQPSPAAASPPLAGSFSARTEPIAASGYQMSAAAYA